MSRLQALLGVFLLLLTAPSFGVPATAGPAAVREPAIAAASKASLRPAALPLRAAGLPKDSVPVSKGTTIPNVPKGYRTFNGGWIQFAFPQSVQGSVEPLMAEADSFRDSLRRSLGYSVLQGIVTVRIADTAREMKALAPAGSPYPKYASGVAYSGLGLILLTVEPLHPNSNHNLSEVFRHELAHVALHDAVGPGHRVPTWLNEGLAVHLSGENSLRRMQSLSMATLSNRLFPLHRLANGFPNDSVGTPIAYAQSADVVRQLLRREELPRFISMIGRIRGGQSFKSAMLNAYGLLPYGIGANSLEDEWRRQVAQTYSFWPVLFGGSVMWTGVLGLVVLGYRRRRKRQRITLARWTVEEDAAAHLSGRTQRVPPRTIQVVVRSRDPDTVAKLELSDKSQELVPSAVVLHKEPSAAEGITKLNVPKVEHEGGWHTLH